MCDETMTSGNDTLAKGHPATQSLIAAFRLLIPDLPKDWKQLMFGKMPGLNTPSGATRLTKIRQCIVAPTQDELNAIQLIINESAPLVEPATKPLSRLSRQGIKKA